jgi:Protein of unknown function (DUF2800)
MHDIAADILTKGRVGWDRAFKELDDEQLDVVTTYVQYVEGQIARLKSREGRPPSVFIESRVTLPHVHNEFYGTADCIIYSPDRSVLKIIDLKCGRGVPVEVRYGPLINPQLAYYATGALSYVSRAYDEGIQVEAAIVQPRLGGIKETIITHDERTELMGQLKFAAREADIDDPPFSAGDWCKFCPRAATCPHLHKLSLETASMEFDEAPPDPHALPTDELARRLNQADTMEKWIAELRRSAEERLTRGYVVPGWKLGLKRPVSKWKDEEAAARALRDLGVSDIYTQQLVSPTQAKRQIEALDWDFDAHLGELVSKESSGVRLMRDRAPDTPPEDDF